ncbi:hypothetical protein [Azospirillum brasilense]|uniref:hypothetical protein n=1 Tax=Azospirillum brasilense TaxID=192 RepID=UPI001552F991|nr:hypothetical protein [Azospirillum brasilense]
MIGSAPEEICDMDQGAGSRTAKPGCGHVRNGPAIRLGSSVLARLERPTSVSAVRF